MNNLKNQTTFNGKRRFVPGKDGVPGDRAKRQRPGGFTWELPILYEPSPDSTSSGQHMRPRTPYRDASSLLEIFGDLRLKPSSPSKALVDSSSNIAKNVQQPVEEISRRSKTQDAKHRHGSKEKCMTPAWYAQYDRLKIFLQKNGNRYPAHRSAKNEQEKSIASWVYFQRSQFRRHGNKYLAKDAKDLLEQLPGWWWNGRRPSTVEKGHHGSIAESVVSRCLSDTRNDTLINDTWLEYYYNLVIYIEDHPGTYPGLVGKWRDLGKWIDQQRKERLRGTLTDRKMVLLEALPGWRR